MRWFAAALCAMGAVLAASCPAVLAAPGPSMLSDSVAGVDCQPLTRREKVAQTVMTGIEATSATPATIELVARHAGSVILFGDNIVDGEQLLRLTRSLRRHARARLLVAVDEEGGRVSRLGEKGIVDRLPSARELSRTKTTDQIHRLATRLGEQMAAVGMDWNLAPVLDVADADASTVIGDRSFSGNPDRVAAVGRAFAAGLRRGGVMSTGKHFPGHGRTTTDSHETLPTVTASLPQLRRRDIKPFKAALPALDAVMSAHVRYTAIDRRRPASLSPAATRILRRDLGYEGILITDALQMGAITQRWTVPQAAEKAIRAGADVVLSGDPATTPAVTARLTQAVADGRISKVRLHQAVTRVLRAKGYGDPRIGCLLGG